MSNLSRLSECGVQRLDRLLEPIGYVPPVEYEAMYYQHQMAPAMVAGVK